MEQDDPTIPIDPDLAPTDPAEPRLRRPRRDVPGAPPERVRAGVLLAVSVGGMLGARYAIARWMPTHPGRLPWATFWTNISGSFLLGLLLVAMLERLPPSRYLAAAL